MLIILSDRTSSCVIFEVIKVFRSSNYQPSLTYKREETIVLKTITILQSKNSNNPIIYLRLEAFRKPSFYIIVVAVR